MVEIGLARLMRECPIGKGAVLGVEHCGERGLEPGFAVHFGQVVEALSGIDDRYVGASLGWRGWNGQLAWHDFDAQATAARYGSEWDVSVGRKFAERYELLVKLADYRAEGFSADTRKVWLQLAATF